MKAGLGTAGKNELDELELENETEREEGSAAAIRSKAERR